MRLCAVCVALTPLCEAWVTLAQSAYGASVENFRLQHGGNYSGSVELGLGMLFNMPESTSDQRGLGGGIAWAWDDNLCSQIDRLFREDLFFAPLVGCRDLKAAMHRAFDSWASNHRAINFIDVTEACRRLHGHVSPNCSLVEVWVTARPPASADATEAATATPTVSVNSDDFRYTSGQPARRWDAASNRFVPMPVIETTGGTIAFGGVRDGADDICWYLDSTFCHHFHELKNISALSNPGVIRTVILSTVVVVSGVALLIQLVLMFPLLAVLRPRLRSDEHEPSCAQRCTAAATVLARRSVFFTALRFVLIATPWLAYRQIFSPCFDCYDFQAAATHEVGHILGLGHPDQAGTLLAVGARGRPAQDVMRSAEVAADAPSCLAPFDGVVPRDERALSRPSMMLAFTQHNPTSCLTPDDLEGLHALYPDCTHASPVVHCTHVAHNIGWVRLGVYCLVPMLVALVAAVCVAACTQRHHLARLRSKEEMLARNSSLLGHVRRRVTHAESYAVQACAALQAQIATENSRVSHAVRVEMNRMLSQHASRSSAAVAPGVPAFPATPATPAVPAAAAAPDAPTAPVVADAQAQPRAPGVAPMPDGQSYPTPTHDRWSFRRKRSNSQRHSYTHSHSSGLAVDNRSPLHERGRPRTRSGTCSSGSSRVFGAVAEMAQRRRAELGVFPGMYGSATNAEPVPIPVKEGSLADGDSCEEPEAHPPPAPPRRLSSGRALRAIAWSSTRRSSFGSRGGASAREVSCRLEEGYTSM